MNHVVEISTSAIGNFVYHGTYNTYLGENLLAVTRKDYGEATDAIGKLAVEVIFEAFNDILPVDLEDSFSMTYKRTYHPRYYNFETDNVIFDFAYSDDLKSWLYNYVVENNENFKRFLAANYTSRDGFISFTPNNWDEWLEDWNEDEWKCVSALLNFFIEDSISESETESYEYDFNEQASEIISEQFTPWEYAERFENGYIGCVYGDYDPEEGYEKYNAYLIDDNGNIINHINLLDENYEIKGAYDAWNNLEYDITKGYTLCDVHSEPCEVPEIKE